MTSSVRWLGPLLLALVLGGGLSGCALTIDSVELGVPVTLSESAVDPPPAGTPFRVTRHPVYFFWGLIPAARPNAEDILAGQVGTGARLANVRITVRSRLTDVLVTVLTAGVIAPRSVTFEGVVVPGAGTEGTGTGP